MYPKFPTKWWDGYNGQATVLIDDLGPEHSWISYYLKIWADHYPFNAESKNTSNIIRPKRIIVTSNYHPSQIWKDDPILLDAIMARFTVIHKQPPPPIVFGKKRSPVKSPVKQESIDEIFKPFAVPIEEEDPTQIKS